MTLSASSPALTRKTGRKIPLTALAAAQSPRCARSKPPEDQDEVQSGTFKGIPEFPGFKLAVDGASAGSV